MMVRGGHDAIGSSIAAVALSVATMLAITSTASASNQFVDQLMVLAVVVHAACIAFGTSRWIGLASVPVVLAIVTESGFSDDPSWIRATAVGCLWFVTMEMSWEAIDRRRKGTRTTGAMARRVQDIAAVLGITLAIGLVASATATFAPERTVLIQALVFVILFGGCVAMIRQVSTGARQREGL